VTQDSDPEALSTRLSRSSSPSLRPAEFYQTVGGDQLPETTAWNISSFQVDFPRSKIYLAALISTSTYCYEVWMGEVRGGKIKKYKEAKEETCIYRLEVCPAYPYIYGRADGLNTKNPTTYRLLRESFCGKYRSPTRTLF